MRRLSPRTVCLVHGDADARTSLAESLDPILPDGVEMPSTGSVYTFEPGKVRRPTGGYGRAVPRGGIGGERDPDEESLGAIRDYLRKTGFRGPLRIQKISEVWCGSEGENI